MSEAETGTWKWLTGCVSSILLTGLAAWFTFGGGFSRAEGQELRTKTEEHSRELAVLKERLDTQQTVLNEVKTAVKEGNRETQTKLDAIYLALPRDDDQSRRPVR